jgi:hypothetical protein
MDLMRQRTVIVLAVAAVLGAVAIIAIAWPRQPVPLGQQIAPGSAVVPCARIDDQVAEILPYYRGAGPDDASRLWGMQAALAARFGNVSELDEPQTLARAETAFGVAVMNTQAAYGNQVRNHPFDAGIDSAIHDLAAACGFTETNAGVIPPGH